MHKDLQDGRWSKMSLVEQMANIGSEVIRALNWKKKGNDKYAQDSNFRALELFDLTLSGKFSGPALKEIARSRELWLDFFSGENQYNQTASMWENYFFALTYAAQNSKKA